MPIMPGVNCYVALPNFPASFMGEGANDAKIWKEKLAESHRTISRLLQEPFQKIAASLDRTKDIMLFVSCL